MKGQFIKIVIMSCAICIARAGRSVLRPRDCSVPKITTRYSDGTKTYSIQDHCLEYYAIFCKFSKKDFNKHMLPTGPITYRNHPEKSVDAQVLRSLAEKVVQEIQDHKTSFTDFVVIKKADFNKRKASGLIILKYKNYPFILKLFLKTPETFVTQSEGIVPRFLFRMGGGTNRHLSGFTRIRNLEKIRERIDESPYWSKMMDLPRKWYWAPKKPRWITIEGTNIGCNGSCTTELPAIYAIIADAIDCERQFCLSNKEDCTFGLQFSLYIGNRMDAHVDNLLVEKGTGKIVVIDTEHFPTMIGLKEPMNYYDYKSWYLQLSGKCFQANFLRTKKMRRDLQQSPQPELYSLND